MHKVADAITAAVNIPFVHIADPTATAIQGAGIATIGLLGTRFTMEQEFYRGRLEGQYGLRVLVPDEEDRETVHRIIYDELCLGTLREESRAAYRAIMARLVAGGAQGLPGLHRDHPPGERAGCHGSALRHHEPARRGGGQTGIGAELQLRGNRRSMDAKSSTPSNDIIYINVPSSAGKTTLSRALQERLPEPYLYMSIDTLIELMPPNVNDWTGERSAIAIASRKRATRQGRKPIASSPGHTARRSLRPSELSS